jgi:hypothetical protein
LRRRQRACAFSPLKTARASGQAGRRKAAAAGRGRRGSQAAEGAVVEGQAAEGEEAGGDEGEEEEGGAAGKVRGSLWKAAPALHGFAARTRARRPPLPPAAE